MNIDSLAIKLYYNAQMGGYLYALLMMPFEPAQKVADYFVLLVHHGVTLYLLWTSYTMGFFRVGVVIAFLHDLSDPFMEIAKVALYSKRTKVYIFNRACRCIICIICNRIHVY